MQIEVSVIIPVHNEELYIKEALESVFSQTLKNFEVIVVDDGSIDKTSEIVKSFDSRIQLLFQENQGISAARNKGVSFARGDWFAFLDGDDVWPTDRLEKMLHLAKQNSGTECIFGLVQQFSGSTLKEGTFVGTELEGTCAGGMLIQKEAFFRVGMFDQGLKIAEFMQWYLAAKSKGVQMMNLAQNVLFRRLHQANHGITQKGHLASEYARVLKAALDERRKKG